jgi:hypothetical protein
VFAWVISRLLANFNHKKFFFIKTNPNVLQTTINIMSFGGFGSNNAFGQQNTQQQSSGFGSSGFGGSGTTGGRFLKIRS